MGLRSVVLDLLFHICDSLLVKVGQRHECESVTGAGPCAPSLFLHHRQLVTALCCHCTNTFCPLPVLFKENNTIITIIKKHQSLGSMSGCFGHSSARWMRWEGNPSPRAVLGQQQEGWLCWELHAVDVGLRAGSVQPSPAPPCCSDAAPKPCHSLGRVVTSMYQQKVTTGRSSRIFLFQNRLAAPRFLQERSGVCS